MDHEGHVGISEDGPGQATKDVSTTGIALCADPTVVSAEQAQTMLKEIGATFRELARKELESRLELGRLLIAIQDRTLWKGMKPAYSTWSDFLAEGFPKITGLRTSTAYDAMELAKSETLKEISPEERAEIPLSNARTLVRLERAAPKRRLPVETIRKARTMPNAEFRREVGVSRGYPVQVWVADKAVGRQVQRIAEILRNATEDAVRSFADFLGSDDIGKRTGDGIDNKIDLILAICKLAWQNEEAEMERAELRELSDFFVGKDPSPNLEMESADQPIDSEWSGEEQSPVVAAS